MNCSHRSDPTIAKRTVDDLLESVRIRFYAGNQPARFYRDRRMLMYALTWPAVWLERRGLFCSSHRYQILITERLEAIRAHGEPARYGAYFPTYLLKCLQDFFERYGDELYGELKHIRNALESVCRSLSFAQKASEQSRQIETLACAHRVLQSQRHARSQSASGQLDLF